MNIAFIVRRLNVRGGTQRQVLSLAQELKKMGHRITIYAVSYDPENCYTDLLHGLEVVALDRVSAGSKSTEYHFLREFFKEHRVAKKLALLISRDTDILNPHDQVSYKVAYYYKKRVKNIPSVWNVNDVPLLQWGYARRREVDDTFRQPFIKRMLYVLFDRYDGIRFMRVQDAIVTLDERSRGLFKRYLGLESRVVRSGLDAEHFPYRARTLSFSRNFRLLTSGIFMPHRRFEDAIRAVRILVDRGYRLSLTILGDYESDRGYYTKLIHLCNELALHDAVHFAGKVSETELAEAYGNHDIYILQSHLQSYGLAAFEAGASGLPIIVSRTAGCHEVLADHKNALFIHPKNPEDIAGRIQELIDNPELYRKLSETGSAFVRDNFSWHNYAENMLGVYKDAMRKKYFQGVTS